MRLRMQGGAEREVVADEQGRFSFDGLRRGVRPAELPPGRRRRCRECGRDPAVPVVDSAGGHHPRPGRAARRGRGGPGTSPSRAGPRRPLSRYRLAARRASSAPPTRAPRSASQQVRVVLGLAAAEYELTGRLDAAMTLLDEAEALAGARRRRVDCGASVRGQRGLLLLRSGRRARRCGRSTRAAEVMDDADAVRPVLDPAQPRRAAPRRRRAGRRPTDDFDRVRRDRRGPAATACYERKARHNLGYVDFLAGRIPRALAAMEEAGALTDGRRTRSLLLDRARVLREAGLAHDADGDPGPGGRRCSGPAGCTRTSAETELVRAECALVEGEAARARRSPGAAERVFARRRQPPVAAQGPAARCCSASGSRARGPAGRAAAAPRCGSSRPGPRELAERLPRRAARRPGPARRAARPRVPAPRGRRARRGADAAPADAGRRPAAVPAADPRGPGAGRAAPRRPGPGRRRGAPRPGRARVLPERLRLARPAHRQRRARAAAGPARARGRRAQRQPGGVLRRRRARPGDLHPAGQRRPAAATSAPPTCSPRCGRPRRRPAASRATRRPARPLARLRARAGSACSATSAPGPGSSRAATATADGGAGQRPGGRDPRRPPGRRAPRSSPTSCTAAGGPRCSRPARRPELVDLAAAGEVDELVQRVRADLDALAMPFLPPPLRGRRTALARRRAAPARRPAARTRSASTGQPLVVSVQRRAGAAALEPAAVAARPARRRDPERDRLAAGRPTPSVVRAPGGVGRRAGAAPRRGRGPPGARHLGRAPSCSPASGATTDVGCAARWPRPTWCTSPRTAPTSRRARCSPRCGWPTARSTPTSSTPADRPAPCVVLSACEAGLATVRPGDEGLGLTSVLLHLGSRSVLAGVARVRDDVAARVMAQVHAAMARRDRQRRRRWRRRWPTRPSRRRSWRSGPPGRPVDDIVAAAHPCLRLHNYATMGGAPRADRVQDFGPSRPVPPAISGAGAHDSAICTFPAAEPRFCRNVQCTLLRPDFVAAGPACTDTRRRRAPLSPRTEHEVSMKENRTVAKFFAGLLMAGAIAVGGMAPAQAKDTGWNGTVAPRDTVTATKLAAQRHRLERHLTRTPRTRSARSPQDLNRQRREQDERVNPPGSSLPAIPPAVLDRQRGQSPHGDCPRCTCPGRRSVAQARSASGRSSPSKSSSAERLDRWRACPAGRRPSRSRAGSGSARRTRP